MKKRILSIAGSASAFLLAAAIVAGAANNTFVTAIGDLIFPFTPPTGAGAATGTGGTIGNAGGQGMAPLNGSQSYTKRVPGTGWNYTAGNFESRMMFRPTTTVAAGYVTMAANPVDGGELCIFTTQTITAFYPTANTGQTLEDAVTTLAANAHVCYTYSIANATWNRSQ